MTSHELARQLLAGPDLMVMISVEDNYGLHSPPRKPDVEKLRWSDEWGMMAPHDEGKPFVTLMPKERG